MVTPSTGNNNGAEPVQVVETPSAPPSAEVLLDVPLSPAPQAPPGTVPTTAAPVPTPAPAPSPYELPPDFQAQSTPPAQGPITDAERQELVYRRQRDQEYRQQAQGQSLDRYYQQAVQFYTSDAGGGLDQQTAQLIANAHRQEREAALEREMGLRTELQGTLRANQETQEVARQFNVNPSALSGIQGRGNQERYAALLKYIGDYRRTTESRLTALEKGRVPEGHFASGGGQGDVVTSDNIDELYSQGRVTDDRYRAFLNSRR